MRLWIMLALHRYRRCTEADHVKRDVRQAEAELQKLEEKRCGREACSACMCYAHARSHLDAHHACTHYLRRRLADEVMALQAQGLPIPEHLLPPVVAQPAKQQGGKQKK